MDKWVAASVTVCERKRKGAHVRGPILWGACLRSAASTRCSTPATRTCVMDNSRVLGQFTHHIWNLDKDLTKQQGHVFYPSSCMNQTLVVVIQMLHYTTYKYMLINKSNAFLSQLSSTQA